MIVDTMPRLHRMSVHVWKPLSLLFVWDVAVTVTYYTLPFHAPPLPLTLFGSALALFLGFRDTSAYQRWWEGRVLWGSMINASRSLSRAVVSFLPDEDEEAREAKRTIVRRQIAYVHTLRRQLRRQEVEADVRRYVDEAEATEALKRTNVANGLLEYNGRQIEVARRRGWIDSIQQATIERVLIDIANAQGGMERLKNTPLPNQYRLFPALFTRLFCALLPIGLVESLGYATPIGSTLAGLMFLAILQIGEDLVDPFSNTVHDVPLSAMCRTIEIDLLQSIGDEAPEPLKPVKGVLW
jgi:putative membrane protein